MSALAPVHSKSISFSELASNLPTDAELREPILADLRTGLRSFISDPEECSQLAAAVVDALGDPVDGITKARLIVAPYRERFWDTFRSRSVGIVENILPAFRDMQDERTDDCPLTCFDWGTGKGRFPGMIQGALPAWVVSGGDVRDYRDTTNFPFFTIESNKVPELASNSQDAALICYVLHHDAHPEEIAAEAFRILNPGGRAVVIELCPRGDSTQALDIDTRRVLFSDLVYCVVWQDENMPMPGMYKTPASWHALFEKSGFTLVQDTPIRGTPLIYGDRHLMVFEKPLVGSYQQLSWDDLWLPKTSQAVVRS